MGVEPTGWSCCGGARWCRGYLAIKNRDFIKIQIIIVGKKIIKNRRPVMQTLDHF